MLWSPRVAANMVCTEFRKLLPRDPFHSRGGVHERREAREAREVLTYIARGYNVSHSTISRSTANRPTGVRAMTNQYDSTKHWVLVEGPKPGDAQFLGQWLLAAAKADKLLQEQFELDPGFKRAVDRLEVVYAFAFSPTATKCIELLMTDLTAFPLSVLGEPFGEAFVVMTELGFFSQTGDRFQMTIPKDTSSEEIKAALLHLANTEDQDFVLHPEHLVQCMDRCDVLDWQARLNRLPYLQRLADRAIFIDGGG